MKATVIIAAALFGTLAVPAFAATNSDDVKMKVTYDAKHDKYCISQDVTGQRLPVRTCRTKAEWVADGAKFSDAADATKHTKLAQK
ncbi:hypothetical protein ACSBM8_04195 [Sphingomonas sp. ASY06-1R]|uniref:hypothetical protein n=1 Tax=Sphingomonas sp. ASY06-1R TaxID=3445771 RepID=UPI003FA28898